MPKWIYKPLKHGGYFARCPNCGQTSKQDERKPYTCQTCHTLINEELQKRLDRLAKIISKEMF